MSKTVCSQASSFEQDGKEAVGEDQKRTVQLTCEQLIPRAILFFPDDKVLLCAQRADSLEHGYYSYSRTSFVEEHWRDGSNHQVLLDEGMGFSSEATDMIYQVVGGRVQRMSIEFTPYRLERMEPVDVYSFECPEAPTSEAVVEEPEEEPSNDDEGETQYTCKDLAASRLLYYPDGECLLEAYNHAAKRSGTFSFNHTAFHEVPHRDGWTDEMEMLESSVINSRDQIVYEVYEQRLRRLMYQLDPYEVKELVPAVVYMMDDAPKEEEKKEEVESPTTSAGRSTEFTSRDLTAKRVYVYANGVNHVSARNNVTGQYSDYFFTDTCIQQAPHRPGWLGLIDVDEGSVIASSMNVFYTVRAGELVRMEQNVFAPTETRELEPVPVKMLSEDLTFEDLLRTKFTCHDLTPLWLLSKPEIHGDYVMMAYNNVTGHTGTFAFSSACIREVRHSRGYPHSKSLCDEGTVISCRDGSCYDVHEGRLRRVTRTYSGPKSVQPPVPVYLLKDGEDQMITELADFVDSMQVKEAEATASIESERDEEDVREDEEDSEEASSYEDDEDEDEDEDEEEDDDATPEPSDDDFSFCKSDDDVEPEARDAVRHDAPGCTIC